MPAGVAVLDRLGLRAAVGGRPLASVRYHGFGMTAESGFAPRADGTVPVVLGQRRWRLDQTLLDVARATPGVRVFGEEAGRGCCDCRRPGVGSAFRVGGELRRGGLTVGGGWPGFARAPLAGVSDRPRPRRHLARRRAHPLIEVCRPGLGQSSACSSRKIGLPPAYNEAGTRRRCPDNAAAARAALPNIAMALGSQRARSRWSALDRRAAAAARLAGRRDAADQTGRARARDPPRARRIRAGRGARRAYAARVDRLSAEQWPVGSRTRFGHRRAAGRDRAARAGRRRPARHSPVSNPRGAGACCARTSG